LTGHHRALGIVLVGVSVVWGAGWFVQRALRGADESSQLVVHTQEVLLADENVLLGAVEAESALRRYLSTGDAREIEALTRAERTATDALDRVAALTADNPDHQRRLPQIRQQLSNAFAQFRGVADARREGRVPAADDLGAADSALDAAREALRTMRLDENRLLATRVQADRVAVQRLEWLSMAALLVGSAFLGGFVWLLTGTVSRERGRAENLLRVKDDLEVQVGARSDELRDQSARLQSVIDSAVDGIIVIDGTGRIESFNRAAEQLFGYPASEVVGRNVNMLMPSPDHEAHNGYLGRYLETGAATIIGIGREVTGRRRDGTTFPLHLSVGEMLIAGERKFTGMLHDLSARVQLEERLRASEERWRSIIESAVDGIIVIDAYGRIEAVNPAVERLFGFREADLIGRNVNMLMPSPYHEEHDVYLARYLATGMRKIIGVGREVTGLRQDRTTFPLHLSVGEMVINEERKFTGILHDLSTRVRMEEQLREQSTLARLGEMAAVLAHEIKNPLAGIRGAIQVIGGRLPEGSRDAAMTKEIVARIDALDGLMKDLLLFARPPRPQLTPVEIVSLVATTADLLREDPMLKGVRIEVEGSAPPIQADPELLKIVFQNLLVNGAHAMQGQGTIRIGITTLENECHIAVSDTGSGIPAEIREKIFTPFFTTKSRGSGLGLPTVKRLIEAHRGTVSVDCPPAGGTIVNIQLPSHVQAV
jgi:PAS domain S-box-containing protein